MSGTTKERPIICRDDEVRAFIEGRKTQLRRPIKPIFSDAFPGTLLFRIDGGIHVPLNDAVALTNAFPRHCPFGVVGDRLWVREAWNMRGLMFGKPAAFAKYASKRAFHYRATDDGKWRSEWGGWRSASQMVRNVSRITLEITNVRVERLQDITKHNAISEGVKRVDLGHGFLSDARCAFRDAWDDRYGQSVDAKTGKQADVAKHPLAWCHNPFVWVIETKVVQA